MKGYSTLAGASRDHSSPIIRILHDPEHLYVPVLSLKTQVHVLTADHPGAPHRRAGSLTLMDMVDAAIEPSPVTLQDIRSAFEKAIKRRYASRLDNPPHSFRLSETGDGYASPGVQAEFEAFATGYRAALEGK